MEIHEIVYSCLFCFYLFHSIIFYSILNYYTIVVPYFCCSKFYVVCLTSHTIVPQMFWREESLYATISGCRCRSRYVPAVSYGY